MEPREAEALEGLPCEARAVANLILDIADSMGVSVYRTSLLKLLFFAHGWCLAKYDRPLVGQLFEAWQHGPVLRVVYDQLRSPAGERIVERMRVLNPRSGQFEIAKATIEPAVQSLIADVISTYSRFYAFELSDKTHEVGSPWHAAWEQAGQGRLPGARIENENIKSYFLRRNEGDMLAS